MKFVDDNDDDDWRQRYTCVNNLPTGKAR